MTTTSMEQKMAFAAASISCARPSALKRRRHTNCEKGYDNSNLYFDDEELDRFKGKKQEEYTDEETEEFRNVLYTMRSDEVDTWVHCLQTRGIEIPQEVKDEILLMLQ